MPLNVWKHSVFSFYRSHIFQKTTLKTNYSPLGGHSRRPVLSANSSASRFYPFFKKKWWKSWYEHSCWADISVEMWVLR